MITLSVNCSCVFVRRVSHVLQKFQGCASDSEAATAFLMKKESAR
jgi:hypothetical protein